MSEPDVMDVVTGIKRQETIELGGPLHDLLASDDSLTDMWLQLADSRMLQVGVYQLMESRRQYYVRGGAQYVRRYVEGLRVDGQPLATPVVGIGYCSQSHKLLLFGAGGRTLPVELLLEGALVARLHDEAE